MSVTLGAGPGCNHEFVNLFVRQVPVFPRDTVIYRVVRLNCPNPTIPDIHFENTHIETMFAAGSITDNIPGLKLAVITCFIHYFAPAGKSNYDLNQTPFDSSA
jgi:hypothetical protein